jgi:hypothetical protein
MTVFTEGRHAASFIMSEANFHRSRDSGVVASGQNFGPGQVLMRNGSSKLVAYDGATASDAVGVAIYGTGGALTADTSFAFIARDAEVNSNLITYPSGDAGNVIADLKALGIIAR